VKKANPEKVMPRESDASFPQIRQNTVRHRPVYPEKEETRGRKHRLRHMEVGNSGVLLSSVHPEALAPERMNSTKKEQLAKKEEMSDWGQKKGMREQQHGGKRERISFRQNKCHA